VTIADLIIKIGVDTKGAEASITGFASKVGSGFRKALVPAAAIIGGAAIGAKKLVDAASDMNETVSKTGVVFGKSAPAVVKWGEGLAKSFGISKQAGLDAVSTFGTFGKSVGKTGDALVKFSEPLVQAAADLASFHNVPVDQALEDIRSGLSGEVEPLRKYGILLNDAALRQQALRMGLVKTTKNALSPQNKMLASQALILKKLGPAHGDFARTANSAANTERTQAAETANLTASLGSGLLPIYQALQGILLKATAVMTAHQGVVKAVAVAVIGLAAGVVLVNAAMAVYSAGAIVVSAATKLWAAAQWLLNAAMAGNPIVLVVAALVALGAALVIAYTHSETFRRIVTEAWAAIKAVAMEVLGWLMANVPAAWAAIQAISASIWNAIVGIVTAVWGRIRGVVMTALGAVKALVQADLQIVKGIIDVVMGLIHGDWSRVWNGIKEITGGILNGIVALIRGVMGTAAAAARALGQAILDGIIGILKTIAGKVTSALSALWGALKGMVGRALSAGAEIGRAIIDGIANGIRGALGNALGAIESAGGSILGKAKSFLHINSPSLLFAREIGGPIMEGIAKGMADNSGMMLGPFQDAKYAVDDWANTKGVDNFTGLGATMAAALHGGMAGGFKAAEGPIATAIGNSTFNNDGLDAPFANAIAKGGLSELGGGDVYLDGAKVGKVMRGSFYGVKRRTGGLAFEGS
jgi:phage-related protein